jgi:hypothetical protein
MTRKLPTRNELARGVYGESCLRGREGHYRRYEPELPSESTWKEEGGGRDDVVVDDDEDELLAVQVKTWQTGEAIA